MPDNPPARKLYTFGGMSIRPYPGPVDLPPPERDASTIRRQDILPNASFFRTEKDHDGRISAEIKADILAGRATLFVYGEIHFIDIFNKDRWIYYRSFCGGGFPNSINRRNGKTVGRLTPHEDGNDSNY
jgi:hypothetical protein